MEKPALASPSPTALPVRLREPATRLDHVGVGEVVRQGQLAHHADGAVVGGGGGGGPGGQAGEEQPAAVDVRLPGARVRPRQVLGVVAGPGLRAGLAAHALADAGAALTDVDVAGVGAVVLVHHRAGAPGRRVAVDPGRRLVVLVAGQTALPAAAQVVLVDVPVAVATVLVDDPALADLRPGLVGPARGEPAEPVRGEVVGVDVPVAVALVRPRDGDAVDGGIGLGGRVARQATRHAGGEVVQDDVDVAAARVLVDDEAAADRGVALVAGAGGHQRLGA